MKKILIFISIITIGIIILSCSNLKSKKKGFIHFYSDNNQTFSITKFNNIGTLDIVKKKLFVKDTKGILDTNKQGKFVQMFLMANNKNYILFAPPRKTINIKITKSGLEFDEKDYLNKFIHNFTLKINKLFSSRKKLDKRIEDINLTKKDLITKLNEIKKNLSQEEYNLLRAIIDGKMAHIKFMLADTYKIKNYNNKYFDFIKTLNINNNQFMNFTDNVNVIHDYLKVRYFRRFNKNFYKSDPDIIFINQELNSKEVASAFTGLIVSDLIPDVSKEEKEILIEEMRINSVFEEYIEHAKTIKAGTSLGKKVGNKAKYLENLKSYDKDFSIDKLKNKIVYVDNWATWCGACLHGIKYFNEKYNKIKDQKDIVFVFVSFDRSEEIWRNYIKKHNFNKKNIIHLFNSENMDTKYAKYYGIRSLPYAYIIDKNHKVANTKPVTFEEASFISFIKNK